MFVFFCILLYLATCYSWYLFGVAQTKDKLKKEIDHNTKLLDLYRRQNIWLFERAEPDIQEECFDTFDGEIKSWLLSAKN